MIIHLKMNYRIAGHKKTLSSFQLICAKLSKTKTHTVTYTYHLNLYKVLHVSSLVTAICLRSEEVL